MSGWARVNPGTPKLLLRETARHFRQDQTRRARRAYKHWLCKLRRREAVLVIREQSEVLP